MNLNALLPLLVLSLATSAISISVSSSRLFEGARNWIASKSMWAGELFGCHFCLSHWVAGVLVFIYRPVIIACGVRWIDLSVSTFTVVGLSAILSGWVLKE